MSRYWNTGYYSQPDDKLLKKNSDATKKKEAKKGKVLNPVVVKGRAITKSWWGNAWCANLERYADYESRLARGKRYIRNGSVLDLEIQKGRVLARVQGTRKTPYKVEIRISPLSEERCQSIIGQCAQKLENIEELMQGNFPLQMQDLFQGEKGLFPTPKEISFQCSCPDWALMCKHVAAALYGVGVRLDENPLLFFELRGIDVGKFIDVTLASKVEAMLANEDKPSDRRIDEADIGALFGISDTVG